MGRKCKYIKSDGNRCQAFAIDGSDFCFSHCPNPEVKKAKHRAVVKGGQSEGYKALKLNLKPVSIRNAEDVILFLNEVINQLRGGKIPPKVASCFGFLTNQLLRAIELNNIEQEVNIIKKVITKRKIAL